MTARDPRVDPRPGDVVTVGFDQRTVKLLTNGGAIHYLSNLHEGLCDVRMWRVWCHGPSAYRSRRAAMKRGNDE